MTYGESAVGLKFNPSGSSDVDACKRMFAEIIDNLDASRGRVSDGEHKRLFSVAITEAQTAQMWAVKAITWGK